MPRLVRAAVSSCVSLTVCRTVVRPFPLSSFSKRQRDPPPAFGGGSRICWARREFAPAAGGGPPRHPKGRTPEPRPQAVKRACGREPWRADQRLPGGPGDGWLGSVAPDLAPVVRLTLAGEGGAGQDALALGISLNARRVPPLVAVPGDVRASRVAQLAHRAATAELGPHRWPPRTDDVEDLAVEAAVRPCSAWRPCARADAPPATAEGPRRSRRSRRIQERGPRNRSGRRTREVTSDPTSSEHPPG